LDFSFEQKAAIFAPLEPSLILAGAGTGKTTVMVERVCQLIKSNQIKSEQILGLTFTNKAASEFKERTIKRLKELEIYGTEPDIATYHAFAQNLLTNYGLRIGVDSDARTLSDSARANFAYQVVKNTKLKLADTPDSLNSVVNKVLKLDNELAEHDIEIDYLIERSTEFADQVAAIGGKQGIMAMAEVSRYRKDLAMLVREFRQAKNVARIIDFADQLRFALAIVRAHSSVKESLRETYQAVLLDEYQDTSVTQRILMTTIFGEGHPVTAVGDPLQAIYGWRGAAVSNIEQFKSHFTKSDGSTATVYYLTTNYRSSQEILDMANTISVNLKSDLTKDHDLVAAGSRKNKTEVKVDLIDTAQNEIEFIIKKINEIKDTTPLSDIAILARKSIVLQDLFEALNAAQLPASFAGTRDLLKVPEVIELLGYLRAIDDPTHNPSLIRILTGPRFQISLRDIALIAKRAKEISNTTRTDLSEADLKAWLNEAVSGVDLAELAVISDAIDSPGEFSYGEGVLDKLKKLSIELSYLRKYQSEPLSDFIYRVLVTTNLLNELKIKSAITSAGKQQAIDEILSLAARYTDSDDAASLTTFLNWLETSEDLSEQLKYKLMPAKNSITLITVHSAKGLEWPVVFLPAVVSGTFPDVGVDAWLKKAELLPPWIRQDSSSLNQLTDFSSKGFDNYEEELKVAQQLEERRLMYVAVTRAQDKLFVSGHNWGFTQSKARKISPFISDFKKLAEKNPKIIGQWQVVGPDEKNPNLINQPIQLWPAVLDSEIQKRINTAASLVRTAEAINESDLKLTNAESEILSAWDKAIESLVNEIAEQTKPVKTVQAPINLNVTRTIEIAQDKNKFAQRLLRPMPRAPFVETKRGTQFHLWVENHYRHPTLLDPFDMPGSLGSEALSDQDLKTMQKNFLASKWADLKPLALEWEFDVKLANRYVRGRIDAVFEIDGRIVIIDWKTGKKENSNELQLSIYRHAWAIRKSVDPNKIDVAFVYLPSLAQHQPTELIDLAEIEQLLINA